MSAAELLLVIASWCGMSTYSRASATQVNACREQMLECVQRGHDSLAVKDIRSTTVVECAKKQKLVD